MRNAPVSEKAPVGVFVGLATLDVIHRIAKAPAVNQKITSTAQFVAAGGPAANAAVTFAGLGGDAILVTALGDDPVAELIRADLAAYGVSVVDAAAGTTRAVPVSAVSVVESTGDRSVVSLDAVNSDASPPGDLGDLVADADVVLVDGHHPLIARASRSTCGGARHHTRRRRRPMETGDERHRAVRDGYGVLQRLPNAGRRQPGVHRRGTGPQRCSHRRHHARRRSRRVVVGWRVRVRAGGTGGGGRHAGRRRCLPRRVLVLLDPDREQCCRAHRSLRSRGGTSVFGGRAAGLAERTPYGTDAKARTVTIEQDVQDVTLDQLVESAKALVVPGERRILGLTGAPGAGKSTVAEQLVTALGPDNAVLVPMDGFHLANEVLIDMGSLDRKGAHDTFDDGGYARLIAALRAQRVDDPVVYEIKSVEVVAPVHKKQLLTYLRLTDKRLGLLINFNVALIKDGITRVVNGLKEESLAKPPSRQDRQGPS